MPSGRRGGEPATQRCNAWMLEDAFEGGDGGLS